MDPVMFDLGPLSLTWHGFFSVLAIVAAVALIRRELRVRGVALPGYDTIAFWTIVGGIVGARLFFFFDHPRTLLNDPTEFFAFTDGGLAIYGALIGGFFAVAILSRVYRFSSRRVIDCIAPGLLLAQAIGRIGCTINGDAWGARTDSPFAFVYTNDDALLPDRLLGVPTHPYPVYDMAVDLAILAFIWWLRRYRLPAGALFAIYALLYAITRALISVVREEKVWFWGMQQAQVISLVVAVLSAVALVWFLREQSPTGPLAATAGQRGADSSPG